MNEALRAALGEDERVAYALIFGSAARGALRADSDVDLAVGFARGSSPGHLELGAWIARLSALAGREIDLVLVGEAPPALRYAVFRDGRELVVRDREALVADKARAILDYLDYQPVERACVDGVLRAARG